MAFESGATNLTTSSTRTVKPTSSCVTSQKGVTRLVSVNRSGNDSGNSFSLGQGLSPDGRFVVFTSDASDLVPNDTNGATDMFVRDLQTGTTAIVSINVTGIDSGDGFSLAACSVGTANS